MAPQKGLISSKMFQKIKYRISFTYLLIVFVMLAIVSAREKIEVLHGLFIHECWDQRVGDPVLEVRLGHHGCVYLPWSVINDTIRVTSHNRNLSNLFQLA